MAKLMVGSVSYPQEESGYTQTVLRALTSSGRSTLMSIAAMAAACAESSNSLRVDHSAETATFRLAPR